MLGSFSNFADPFWFISIPMGIIGFCITIVGSIINNAQDSSRFPIFSWWGLAFEGLIIIWIIYVVWSNRVRQYKQAILSCLAIATVYTSNSTNNFVWRNSITSGATAAGNILLSIINIIWIFYFGTSHDEPIHCVIDSYSGIKMPDRYRHPERSSRRIDIEKGMNVNPTDDSGLGFPRSPRAAQQRISHKPEETYGIRNSSPKADTDAGAENSSYHHQWRYSESAGTHSHNPNRSGTHDTNNANIVELGRGRPNTLEIADNPDFIKTISTGSTDVTEEIDDREAKADDDYQNMSYPYRARAKYSYIANSNEGEVSFKKGEILEVSDMKSKWWVCRRANGEVGICPNNYLETISTGEAQSNLNYD